MTTSKQGLFPHNAVPSVGDVVDLFGERATITIVEPYSDWVWSIEGNFGSGNDFRLLLPTDYRTDDGYPVHLC